MSSPPGSLSRYHQPKSTTFSQHPAEICLHVGISHPPLGSTGSTTQLAPLMANWMEGGGEGGRMHACRWSVHTDPEQKLSSTILQPAQEVAHSGRLYRVLLAPPLLRDHCPAKDGGCCPRMRPQRTSCSPPSPAQPRFPNSPPIPRPYHPWLGPLAQDLLCCWHLSQSSDRKKGRLNPRPKDWGDRTNPREILGVPKRSGAALESRDRAGARLPGEPLNHLHRVVLRTLACKQLYRHSLSFLLC